MQRRAAATGPFRGGPSAGLSSSRNLSKRRGTAGKKRRFNHVTLLVILVFIIIVISWMLFPDEVIKAEQEAEIVGIQIREKAIRAEHNVEDWIQHRQPQHGQNDDVSNSASTSMMTQSSKWVDGEKKLKKKLTELYEKQQKGELLGVPVLTRWLGDDFPAWVTPDMDEEQWRKDVAEKYREMREEEEEWKIEMQKIIEQREHELAGL